MKKPNVNNDELYILGLWRLKAGYTLLPIKQLVHGLWVILFTFTIKPC